MKKIIILSLLLILVYGCTTDPLDIAKSYPEAQEFLKAHPDAKLKYIEVTEDESEVFIDEIYTVCGMEMIPKHYYIFTIYVPGSNDNMRLYYDINNQSMDCTITLRVFGERCSFLGGVDCLDKPKTTPDSITLALRNNLGFPIEIKSISGNRDYIACSGAKVASDTKRKEYSELPVTIENNNYPFNVQLSNNCGFESGEKTRGNIFITYVNKETEIETQVMGSIASTVE